MDFAGIPVLPQLSVSLASTGDAGGCQDLVPQTRQDLGSWHVGLPLLSEPSQVLGSHLSTGCGRDLQTQGDRRAAPETLTATPARALREQTPHHRKRRSSGNSPCHGETARPRLHRRVQAMSLITPAPARLWLGNGQAVTPPC